MKTVLRAILTIGLVVIGSATALHAQMPGPSEQLRGELKAVGVDASQIDWVVMDSLCGVHRLKPEAYETCLKQKAIDQRDYRNDEEGCRKLAQEAQRQLPFPVAPVVRWQVPPKDFPNQAARHDYYRKYHRLLKTEEGVEAGIVTDNSFEACMQEKRWIDPRNWRAGRPQPAK
jgi:hypothetical protein